ncbi:DUF3102 domain-containing protein [Nostoc sp.]
MKNLLELAENINQAHLRSQHLYQQQTDALLEALTSDRNAGAWLSEAKSLLPHGGFIEWVDSNCKFTIRHAQRLMSIDKNWEKFLAAWSNAKCDTGDVFDSPLPSLKVALLFLSVKATPESPPPPIITKFKVASIGHPHYGKVVEVKKELHHGDVLLCETSSGDEIPFLRKELIAENQPLLNDEIIDVEVTDSDNSEQLKEAIALIIEYLPELQLKQILISALSIGKDYLPSDAQNMAVKLIGGQEMLALSN